MFKLREYQEEGIKSCIEVLTSKKPTKDLVVAPVAAGKSLYLAYAAKSVDYPLIVLQPSKELLVQNYIKFTQVGGEASIYSASLKEKQIEGRAYTSIEGIEIPCEEIGKVTYATIGSIMKDIEKFKKLGVKGICIDEAHLGTQKDNQIKRFIKRANIKNVLGLTATPIYLQSTMQGAELKMMNRVRGKLFKSIKHVTQIKELVENKYWTPLVYRNIQEDGSILKPNSNGSDFTLSSQADYYETNNLDKTVKWIVEKLEEQGVRKSILIFVPTIAQAEELKLKIPGSETVHSKKSVKERKRVVDGFKNLKIKVVINCSILTTGFDHPQLDTIIVTRPTMSMALWYQILGRGCRIHPEKESCAIIDLSGNYDRFGRIEDINFEDLEGYGWGMFSKDKLLSGFPLIGTKRPTKKTLQIKRGSFGSVVLYFGKYKNKTVKQVAQKDPQYLLWLNDNYTFRGKKGRILKEDINKYFRLE